jgi:hypothetical protein
MSFFDLDFDYDVKSIVARHLSCVCVFIVYVSIVARHLSIVARHLSNDKNVNIMFMSKPFDFQKLLFGEIVFDEEYNEIQKKPDRISDDDNFNNCKINKISNVLNVNLYIGVTCDALKTCLSNYNKESELKRNQRYVCMYVCIMHMYIHMYICVYIYV